MFPNFEILGITIQMYWLSAMVGLIFAMGLALLRRRAVRFHTSAEDVFLIILCCVIGTLLGAKGFQLIGNILRDGGSPSFWTLENWKQLMPGVGVFYGGLIGGFTAVMIYIRKYKLDFCDVGDILMPSVLLFHAFGRLGCFLAGCCYGRATSCCIGFAVGHTNLIPVQLFESGFNLIVLAVLLITRPERKWQGVLLPVYLITYAIGRFILEFFRGDVGRGIFLLSTSQWISLVVAPAGIILLFWVIKRQNYCNNKNDQMI